MKKTLQILVGLFLILLLAYFAFLDVSAKRKSDLLLSETKLIESDKNLTQATEVRVELKEKDVKTKVVVENNLTQIPLSTPTVINKESVVETAPVKAVVEETVVKKIITPVLTPTPLQKTVIETTIIPTPMKSSVNIPTVVTVPKPIMSTVDVPKPVKAITAPIAVQTEKAIELKTKGVE